MNILLVEDHRQYADLIREKLVEDFGFEVVVSSNPDDANELLRLRTYDVVVVDVLYRALSERYDMQRARARQSLLQLVPYNLSGLAVLYQATQLPVRPGLVVWTSGDPNRALHIVLARQEFGVKCYCSKESPIEDMARAITAAADRDTFVDMGLMPFLPRSGMPQIRDILFREFKWRAIWRALAAGSQAHEVTARMTHYDEQTIRKSMSPMAHQLSIINSEINPNRQQLNQLSSYARYHWEFFLDKAVFEMFPH